MIDFSQMVTAEEKIAAAIEAATATVSAERDRRLNGGFVHNGVLFQSRQKDIANINGAVTAATIAILSGAGAAGLRWSNPYKDFEWIAADNSMVPMDAYAMQAFGFAALAHIDSTTHAARRIKDRLISGESFDITADAEWQAPN